VQGNDFFFANKEPDKVIDLKKFPPIARAFDRRIKAEQVGGGFPGYDVTISTDSIPAPIELENSDLFWFDGGVITVVPVGQQINFRGVRRLSFQLVQERPRVQVEDAVILKNQGEGNIFFNHVPVNAEMTESAADFPPAEAVSVRGEHKLAKLGLSKVLAVHPVKDFRFQFESGAFPQDVFPAVPATRQINDVYFHRKPR
jgi:hypothetical protein